MESGKPIFDGCGENEKCRMLAETFAGRYISIAELDLCTGEALMLQSAAEPALQGTRMPWPELLERYLPRAFEEDRTLVRSLTLEHLRALGTDGGPAAELRSYITPDRYDWVEVNVLPVRGEENRRIVTTRSINHERMMRRIIEMFVYRSCFVLIDAKSNRYTMFSGSADGLPLPPAQGGDYRAEMERYNARYAAPEDVRRVTENMRTAHVMAMLETSDRYSFTCGLISDAQEYSRAHIEFTYYDKPAGLILLTRTDVTQIYADEQAKGARLAAAMRQARCDAMTGLYNQRATMELVTRALDRQYRNMAAVLFVDVDNFKMVNDTLGHGKGDELLVLLAGALRDAAGRSGIAGRAGGTNFFCSCRTCRIPGTPRAVPRGSAARSRTIRKPCRPG